MNKLNMIQTSKHKWRIETESGTVMQEDINIFSEYEAEEYIKRYVSSFQSFSYDLKPKKDKNDKSK